MKTAADLRMEQMMERMDAIEASYKAQIAELQEANRSLWAAAHPAVEESPVTQPSGAGWDDAKVEKSFFQALGRRE